MASNKKPSIYSDRSSIGSVNELDEYGVWVKSEPQVLSADSADTNKSGDFNNTAAFVSDELSADDALSFDDAVLDVNGISQGGSSAFSDMEFPDDNIEIETSDDSFSIDSNLDDINIPDTELTVPQDNFQSDSFEIEDTSFDDFETPVEDSGIETGASTDDNFDIKDDLDFNDLTVPEQVKSGAQDGLSNDSFKTDDFETDSFTVPTVKAIENDIESIQDDFESFAGVKESDLSTQLLLKIADELSSIRGELSELKKEFSGLRPAVSATDEKNDQSGFFSEEDDETIALTGDELVNILGSTDAPVQQAAAIEDDDEDETIALTGDELDNILNSADFTEESGTNETVENDFSLDEEPEVSHDETEVTKSDDDIVFDADLVTLDDADDLGSGIAASGADVDLDTGIKALDDDEIASGLAPADEDLDLGADLTAIDDDVDLDTGIKALDDDEIGSGLAPADELIDIDTDDLNIDLDPDTLLDEQNVVEENPLSFDTETSKEISDAIDADFSGMDLTDDILKDSEIHDSPELKQLRTEGVTPVTTAPENSSYLETEEDVNSDSLDLSDAVIDEPVLSTDGINDDIEEPSLNDSEFDLESLDDLTIDNPEIESKPEKEPVLSQDTFDDIDIDIPQNDFSPETSAFDAEETLIPEGFEAEIEEKSIPFDDDLDEDIAANDFNGALDIPGMPADDFSSMDDFSVDSPFEDISTFEAPPPKAAPKQAPAPKAAPEPQEAPEPQVVAQEESLPAPKPPVPPPHLGKNAFKIPSELKSELRNILSYMDQLLESLPEEKIEEFAKSTYFDSYKKLFKELGLV